MSCKCVDNRDVLLQILEELKKHTRYYEGKEHIKEEQTPAKKKPTGRKRSPALPLSQRAQELYIKTKVSKEESDEGNNEDVHEYYLKKWYSLSEEKKNKWKKKVEKVAPDVAKTPSKKKAPVMKKPIKTSSFQVFTSQNLHKLKGTLPSKEAMRQNAEDWKNLNEQERQKYQLEADKNTKEKFEEFERYLEGLPEEEREAYEDDLKRQENERKEKIAQRRKSAGNKKQAEIKQYLDVSGYSKPVKEKNKLRAVQSDPCGEEDSDELSDQYEFLSTSTPIHNSKISDKLQPANKLKEKAKSNIESSKIVTPRKKLKRTIENDQEHVKNMPQPKKKKIVDTPTSAKKVQKESEDSSSSESDTEETTNKTKKSPVAAVEQSEKKSKKPKKAKESSDSSESDSEETTSKQKKSNIPKKETSEKSAKKKKGSDSTSSSESESEREGTTIRQVKKSSKKKAALEKKMVKGEKISSSSYSSSESDSSEEKVKKSSLKKSPVKGLMKPKTALPPKAKKKIMRNNPYTKEMVDTDSDSESEKEKTVKPTSPKKSKFQALNSKSKSSTSSSTDDSDSD